MNALESSSAHGHHKQKQPVGSRRAGLLSLSAFQRLMLLSPCLLMIWVLTYFVIDASL